MIEWGKCLIVLLPKLSSGHVLTGDTVGVCVVTVPVNLSCSRKWFFIIIIYTKN